MIKFKYSGCLGGLFLLLVCKLANGEEPTLGLNIGWEQNFQEYENSFLNSNLDVNSNINTIFVSPSLRWNNWTVSASLPWQQVDGEYFINHNYPNFSAVCSTIADLSTLHQQLLLNFGDLTEQQLQFCSQVTDGRSQSGEIASGLSDIELFANYYLPFFGGNWETSLGVGFKWDNGDEQVGLGTGTQDLFLEGSWYLEQRQFSLLAVLGYNQIVKNNTGFDYLDYGYTSLDLRLRLLSWLQPGVEYHFQQSNAGGYDDLDYVIGYLQLSNTKYWRGRLYYTDYLDQSGYPNQEYGGAVYWVF